MLRQSDRVFVLDYPSGRDRIEYYDIEAGQNLASLWIEIPGKVDRPIAIRGSFCTSEAYVTVQGERFVVLFDECGCFLVFDTETYAFAHMEFWTREVVEFDSFLVFYGYQELVVLRGDKFAQVAFDHDFGIGQSGEAIVVFDPSGFVNVKDGSFNGDLDRDIEVKSFFQSRQQPLLFKKCEVMTVSP